MKINSYTETYKKFENQEFENCLKNSIDKIYNSNNSLEKLQTNKTRYSKQIRLCCNGGHYIVDVEEYEFTLNEKIINYLTSYKSVNNDYFFISIN